MDENKKELVPSEEADAQSAPETAANDAEVVESVEEQTEVLAQEESEAQTDKEGDAEPAADTDSTFLVEEVESDAALAEFLSGEETDSYGEEASEEELQLATYAADCESCATKVYFELEDLDEEDNLICPNCNETIEINRESIDYYLVDKSKIETVESGNYVVDCTACEAVVHFKEDDIDDEENIVCPQCGEKIHIETEVLDAYSEKDLEKSLKTKRLLKKVGGIVLGVVLALAISCAVIFFVGNKSVVKVDGTSVPMNIYKCVYYIENAVNYTSSGYNMEEKASKQAYKDSDDYENWDDFLKDQTTNALKLYYGIYNEGTKAGYEMTEKDKESVTSAIKNIKSYAASANLSFDDYMKSQYGLKISEKDFTPYLELTAYVNSYYKSVMGKDITKEQLEKIYKENPENYNVVTFRYYYVQVSETITKDDALKVVEKISKAKTEEEFHKLVLSSVNKENAANYKDSDSTLVKDMACSNIQNRPVAKLLTDEKAKKGQTIFGLSEDNTFAEVAMLVEPKHKSDEMIKEAAINEVSSEKGQKYIEKIQKSVTVKSSLGMILRNIAF
ncbi:MAG: hypothetical protein IJG23_01580 [Clostridia bacterium]|nr:hypothetical protein [Clostridia bacterium]